MTDDEREDLPAFIKNAGSLSIGTLARISLLFIVSPVLTRLYDPTAFGVFNAVSGAATLIATICSFSFPFAIPLAETDHQASDLTWLTIFSAAALVAPTTWIASTFVNQGSGKQIAALDWLVGGGIAVATAIWASIRSLNARHGHFKSVAQGGVVDAGVQSASQVLFGVLSFGPLGLGVGYLAGKVASAALLFRSTRSDRMRPIRHWSSGRSWARHGLIITPQTVLNQASISAVGPITVSLYSAALGGQFGLAYRVLSVPAEFLGQAVGDVFFARIAGRMRDGLPSQHLVEAVATILLNLAFVPFTAVCLFGPELFGLIFGPEWNEAGVVAAVLSPWLILNLVFSPLSTVMNSHRRWWAMLMFGASECVMRIGALVLGNILGSWRLGIVLYSVSGIVISLVGISWALRLSGSGLASWLSSISKFHGILAVLIGVLVFFKTKLSFGDFLLIGSVLLALQIATTTFSIKSTLERARE